MSLRLLIVSATDAEADALKKIPGIKPSLEGFSFGKFEISLLVTGVGSIATSWEMTKWLSANPKPDMVINIGIAGSYNDNLAPGEVVIPVSDCFADAGIEDGENFLTMFEAGLARADDFPFRTGFLPVDKEFIARVESSLKQVKSITVNTSTGSESTRNKLLKKFNPDIETMEGATFFYICIRNKIPFLALRAISNRVEPRNKDNWNIPLAIDNLSEKLYEVLIILE